MSAPKWKILRRTALLFCIIILVDQTSKSFASNIVNQVPDLQLAIKPTENQTLIFGLDPDLPANLIVPLVVGTSLLWSAVVWSVAPSGRTALALSGFWAGMVGNVVDRMIIGAVRDWLVLGSTVWNIADFALLWGMLACLLYTSVSLSADRRNERG